jgi:hypothetical protein
MLTHRRRMAGLTVRQAVFAAQQVFDGLALADEVGCRRPP